MTEREYRALEIDSYSSFKAFIEDRKKYYKKYILKETIKDDTSEDMIYGLLVDTLLLEPDEYDNRFTLAISQVPSGQYALLVNEMFKIAMACVDESGQVSKDDDTILEEAYERVKHDRNGTIVAFKRDSVDKAKEKFFGTDLEVNYKQRLEAEGKYVIELSTLEKAQQGISELKSNFITKDIINAVNTPEITVYNQFPIVGEIGSNLTKSIPYPAKCLVDKLIINHRERKISIYDIKATWDNENEFIKKFFLYKYYLQAGLYYYLVVEWKNSIKELDGYSVDFPTFVVVESNNYKMPLKYTTDIEVVKQGMKGFTIRGKYYPGILSAVQDLTWHKEMAIWNVSRENYVNDGVVKIKPFEN